MKKILTILFMMLMCIGVNAQEYSQELVDKAESGDARAMSDLGECYAAGRAPEPINYSKAFYWYKKAAEKGNTSAMGSLAWCYKYGHGVAKNYSKEIYWYKEAAEKGNVNAMLDLANCYEEGHGVAKNYSKALYWYKKAAEKGNFMAMYQLRSCFKNGKWVKKDLAKAEILRSAERKVKSGDKQGAVDLVYQVFPDLKSDNNYASNTPAASNNKAASYKKAVTNSKSVSYDKAVTNNKTSSYKKTVNPPIIQIVPGSISFADATGNNAIDANETCSVRFKVKNIGKGAGYNCVAKVKSSAYGINAGVKKINRINAGETIDVEISVISDMNTKDGTTDLSVWVDEPNGLGCDPTILSVNTNAFATPMLKIVDYATTSEAGGKLRKMQPFTLQMILQNTQHGNAEDVNVRIDLPKDVLLVDGESSKSYTIINGGDKKNISVGLMAKNVYTASSIPVKVTISEKYGKYAESRTINLAMNQQMSANRIVIDENETSTVGNIEIAQIEGKLKLSDVDQNIPHNTPVNDNTFAVIIANENYRKEAKVAYALNDGKMFGVYCQEVLGLPEDNIHVLKDATLNEIRGGVNWLRKVAEAYNGDANLIFYYAGHGVPDESTKDAYMLPVDGYGNDLITAYKMEDLYATLSSCPSKQTLVFLDACFSGKQRSGKEMSTVRAVGISTRKTAPKGNMVVFSAAQSDEVAHTYDDKQHGMFTYYLLKKLQLSKGNVTLGELGSYIKDNVQRKSVVKKSKSQTPTVMPSQSMAKNWRDVRL